MENTVEKDIVKLQKFGKIEKINELKKKDATGYILQYDLNQISIFQELELDTVPIAVLVKKNGLANCRMYFLMKDKKVTEKIIEEVNETNSTINDAKFYIDGAGDICCETTISLVSSEQKEIEKCLSNLVIGFFLIALSLDEENEEK